LSGGKTKGGNIGVLSAEQNVVIDGAKRRKVGRSSSLKVTFPLSNKFPETLSNVSLKIISLAEYANNTLLLFGY